MEHLDDSILRHYIARELPRAQHWSATWHINQCASCRARHWSLVTVDDPQSHIMRLVSAEYGAFPATGKTPWSLFPVYRGRRWALVGAALAVLLLIFVAAWRRPAAERLRPVLTARQEASSPTPTPFASQGATAATPYSAQASVAPTAHQAPGKQQPDTKINPAPTPATDAAEPLVARLLSHRPIALTGLATPGALVVRSANGAPPTATLNSLRPAGEVVAQARPTLTWQSSRPGPFQVVILNEQFQEVVRATTNVAHYTPEPDLPRGHRYLWRVSLLPDSDASDPTTRTVVASAMFAVADTKTVSRLTPTISQTPSLLRAAQLAQAGLLRAAETELSLLLRRQPTNLRARKLLQRMRVWRSANP